MSSEFPDEQRWVANHYLSLCLVPCAGLTGLICAAVDPEKTKDLVTAAQCLATMAGVCVVLRVLLRRPKLPPGYEILGPLPPTIRARGAMAIGLATLIGTGGMQLMSTCLLQSSSFPDLLLGGCVAAAWAGVAAYVLGSSLYGVRRVDGKKKGSGFELAIMMFVVPFGSDLLQNWQKLGLGAALVEAARIELALVGTLVPAWLVYQWLKPPLGRESREHSQN